MVSSCQLHPISPSRPYTRRSPGSLPASFSILEKRGHSAAALGEQPFTSARRRDCAPMAARTKASRPRRPKPALPPKRNDFRDGHFGMHVAATTTPLSSSDASEASKMTSAEPRPDTSAAKPSPSGFRATPSSRSCSQLFSAAPSAVAPAAPILFSSKRRVCNFAPTPAFRALARETAPASPRRHFHRPTSSRVGSGAERRPSARAWALPEGGPRVRLGICRSLGFEKTMLLLMFRMSSSMGGRGNGSGSGGGRRHVAVRGISNSTRSARVSSTSSCNLIRRESMCGALQISTTMVLVNLSESAMAFFSPAEAQAARVPGARIRATARKPFLSSSSATLASMPAEPPIMLSSSSAGASGEPSSSPGGPSLIFSSMRSSGTSASAARDSFRMPSMSASFRIASGPGPTSL
mmetsp:Transcript_16385/g.51332  ORF Transcript_16385/g.51332 Transcript_16385/m.51332 type:complete len:409 (-) Transcript_16385:7-1233(-)